MAYTMLTNGSYNEIISALNSYGAGLSSNASESDIASKIASLHRDMRIRSRSNYEQNQDSGDVTFVAELYVYYYGSNDVISGYTRYSNNNNSDTSTECITISETPTV